jgi:hypothetical protein
MSAIYVSPIGLSVFDDKDEYGHFTITGNPKKSVTIVEFESAYDFEEFIQGKIKCDAIDFDSESCQFFAYAKTKAQAISFVTRVEKYFDKVKKMLE